MEKQDVRNLLHQTVFDILAERYESTFGSCSYALDVVKELSERLVLGAKVLDVGCGTGLPATKELVKAGFDVTGIDSSEKMIDVARKNVQEAVFYNMNMQRMTFLEAEFDAITALSSMLFLSQESFLSSLKEIARISKKGGLFFFSLVEGTKKDLEIPILFKKNKGGGYFSVKNVSMRITQYQEKEIYVLMQAFPFQLVKVSRYEHNVDFDSRSETHICFCYKKIS